MERARQWGDVIIVRLFGDFTANRHAEWCRLALAAGYEPILQLNGGAGKNSTDIALTIHAMDLFHGASFEGFCLVSNDRDFVPLAMRLRSAGKHVYAICRQADARIQKACTETFTLAPAQAPPPPILAAFLEVSDGRR